MSAKQKILTGGLLLLLVVFLLIPSPDYFQTDMANILAPVSSAHWLGTDHLGRDVLALMQAGALRTLTVVAVGGSLSLILGIVAGYYGGYWKRTILLFAQALLILPSFIMALIITALIGLTPISAGIVLGIGAMGNYIFQVSALTEELKEEEFIITLRKLGLSNCALIKDHLAKNLQPYILTNLANRLSGMVLSYASLAFIGLGTDIVQPDWGTLLYDYRLYVFERPLLVLAPTLAIFILALLFQALFDRQAVLERWWLMDSKPLLSIKNLQVAVQGQTYVKNLSLEVYPGERLGLVGPSGAGKSLTVKAIMNFQDQVQVKGQVYYQGLGDIVDLSPKGRQQALPQEIAVIQQEALDSLNPHYDIGFQLELVMKQFQPQVDKTDYPAVFDRVLKQVNLNHSDQVLASKPAQLSGGMKQRIVIAMALLQKPRLILADEPTTALDRVNQETFIDLIKSVSQAENIALLFISHNLELVSQLCSRLVIIDQGHDIETNSAQAIFNHPQASTTQRLVESVAYRKAASQDFVSQRPQGQEPVLKTQDLSLHYPGADKPVLQEVNLDLYPGEFVGLVGESGSGKSSLAKLLTGLYPKSQGEIIFKGQTLNSQSLEDFQGIQMIFQNPYQAFDPHYRMEENLKEVYQIPYIKAKYPSPETFEAKLKELAQRLKLNQDLMAKSPKQLSGGQGQRFAILRILLAQPDVIIADEILSALDWDIALELIDLLKDLQKDQDFAMIFISHDLAMVKILCTRIYQIEAGRISQL